MTRDTAHGTKGSSIVRAMAAALLVASMFAFSALTASAQDTGSSFDPEDLPTPQEACELVLPDGVSVSDIVADLLADSDLPQEVIDQAVDAASAGDFTCADLFAAET